MAPVPTIRDEALRAFVESVLVRLGARAGDAATVARALVDADLHGIDTHGVARLPAYVRLVDRGLLNLEAEPVLSHDGGAVATVDGDNGFGQVVGETSIDLACRLAQQYGIGWVTAINSNHFGTVGYYTRRAAARGLVAFGGTNSAAVVAPTRGITRFLGTNPLAFSVPGTEGIAIDLDMSTSSVSGGKLEQAVRTGSAIPEGWLIDAAGQPVTDPTRGLSEGGCLLPLGGTELHSSYKGYGLAMMIEVFCSALMSAPYGRSVGPLTSGAPTFPAQVSHFFMVLDPGRFQDPSSFRRHVDAFCDDARAQRPADEGSPVLVPGDPEASSLAQRRRGGIPLHERVVEALDDLATRFALETLSSQLTPPTAGGSSNHE